MRNFAPGCCGTWSASEWLQLCTWVQQTYFRFTISKNLAWWVVTWRTSKTTELSKLCLPWRCFWRDFLHQHQHQHQDHYSSHSSSAHVRQDVAECCQRLLINWAVSMKDMWAVELSFMPGNPTARCPSVFHCIPTWSGYKLSSIVLFRNLPTRIFGGGTDKHV